MINNWLGRHPRFHIHFTPTGSSWVNQVERFFGLITDKLIRRGVHTSVAALEATSGNGSTPATRTRNPSPGPKQQTKSSTRSQYIRRAFQAQDASVELRNPQMLGPYLTPTNIGIRQTRAISSCAAQLQVRGNEGAL